MRLLARSAVLRSLVPLLATLLAACENPVQKKEDHPVGLVMVNAQGQQVASYRLVSGGTGQVTGQITVPRGTATTFTVAAVGESGSQVVIDGSELGLTASLTGGEGTAVVQGANRVTITSTQGGTRSLQLRLTHDGHTELDATLPVIVTG